jgi:hypothetical protein
MIIKKQLLVVMVLLFLTISCSSDEDSRDNYPQNKDITFSITSSDNNRLSTIEYTIEGDDLNIFESSYSESHLPKTNNYLSLSIPYSTNLEIYYKDNSGGEVGVPFDPYTILLEIKVDSNVIAEKEATINETGTVETLDFIFN